MAEDITTVNLPIPSAYQRNFGVHATSYQGARLFSQRYSEADVALITKYAAQLEIPIGTFIKESAINMAKALELKEKAHAQHDIRSG